LAIAGLAAMTIVTPAFASVPGAVPVVTESITSGPEASAPEPDIKATEPPAASTPAPPVDLPAIEYDVSKLPEPVRRLRQQILDACKTGDPQQLKIIIDGNDGAPDFGQAEGADPLTALLSQSGDEGGREILAILSEVLEAGYVHLDVGTPQELYVWPYFAQYPIDKLTPPQLVELFRLVYAGDYEEMLDYGHYTYFRAGITPSGQWAFFVTD
jgi:hypothetical protein